MERTYHPDPGATQVVVLMGGLGTRLGQIGRERPKAMMPVCDEPFFAHQMKLMKLSGFRKFLFLVGYRADAVKAFFGDGSDRGVDIRYLSDEGRQLGTGGAIRQALSLLEEDFMLIYGDSFMDVDFRNILFHYLEARSCGNDALMSVLKNDGQFERSNAVVADGRILLYDKKRPVPEMHYVDYGISMFKRAVFEGLPEGEKLDLSEIQHRLSTENRLGCSEVAHRFYEIGSPTSLEEFEAYAKERFTRARPAAFLDRDGVINDLLRDDTSGLYDSPMEWSQFRMKERVPEAIRLLKQKGYWVFVVTNQPAAAKGKTSFRALTEINTCMEKQLEELDAGVDGVMVCPHHPEGNRERGVSELIRVCDCRKPGPGMLLSLMSKFNIDPKRSYMVGDSYTDALAGRAAGVKVVLVDAEQPGRRIPVGGEEADMSVKDLYAFALAASHEEKEAFR